MHGGLSPDLQSLEQIHRMARPTDVPEAGTFMTMTKFKPYVCGEGGEGFRSSLLSLICLYIFLFFLCPAFLPPFVFFFHRHPL
jgi:hypothetical protein